MGRMVVTGSLLAALVGGCGGDKTYQPSRSERDGVVILRLVGTPYEMGLQHGELMAAELAEGAAFVEADASFSLMLSLARSEGFTDDALANTYPDAFEECRGMTEAARRAGAPGWDMEKCTLLAYGDVVIEHLGQMLGGCTQFAARGPATADGQLLHGRSLDWGDIRYLLENPTLIVRRPAGGIPYVVIGFPGCVAPYSGINDAGLSLASNENDALDDIDRTGRSHVQMLREILRGQRRLEEAEAFLRAQDHMTAESVMIADGAGAAAAVFEMTANHLGVRRLDGNGLVYMTNHFVEPSMAPLHEAYEPDRSSRTRFQRLRELLEPGGEDSLYGQLDVAAAVGVLRDTRNPYTGVTHPPELFDGGGSIANNAAVYSMVFAPARRMLWVAMGELPVPPRPFVGYHLDELFEIDAEAVAEPRVVE